MKVKWGKEVFKDVECDTDEPPMLFKSTLFSLSGVMPDRMKVMVKGAVIGVRAILNSLRESTFCLLDTKFRYRRGMPRSIEQPPLSRNEECVYPAGRGLVQREEPEEQYHDDDDWKCE